jgi:hypothetical protein
MMAAGRSSEAQNLFVKSVRIYPENREAVKYLQSLELSFITVSERSLANWKKISSRLFTHFRVAIRFIILVRCFLVSAPVTHVDQRFFLFLLPFPMRVSCRLAFSRWKRQHSECSEVIWRTYVLKHGLSFCQTNDFCVITCVICDDNVAALCRVCVQDACRDEPGRSEALGPSPPVGPPSSRGPGQRADLHRA